MKRLIIISIYILLVVAGSAQPKQRYTSNLDSYAGTWVYNSGGETFTLNIVKGKENTSIFYGDCLIGGYKHVKNGQVQGDYTQNIPATITEDYYDGLNCPSFFGTNGSSNPNMIRPYVVFFFWDRGYGEEMLRGSFKLLSPTTAQFEVWEMEDISGATVGQQISVPKKVVMTKMQ